MYITYNNKAMGTCKVKDLKKEMVMAVSQLKEKKQKEGKLK